ncbi:hypothetical protein BB561_000910 [Smittium simulii]|uniref:Uncharacterized protein n=1 Tax=Smittium simulii TaxID=133385 RepID=A0A2T9YWT8_9FUNG|nr:hypothetical protein BB561_000910 [Smittium simulii]
MSVVYKTLILLFVLGLVLVSGQASSNSDSPSPTDSESSPKSQESNTSAEYALPTILTVTTPVNAPPILFELGTSVKLAWKIESNFLPVNKTVSIYASMPEGKPEYVDPSTRKPYTWDIATNITSDTVTWDTRTVTPKGINLSAIPGYKLIFYDSAVGRGNFTSFYTPLTFALFSSEYDRTNEGIPDTYDPSKATSVSPSLFCISMALLYTLFYA